MCQSRHKPRGEGRKVSNQKSIQEINGQSLVNQRSKVRPRQSRRRSSSTVPPTRDDDENGSWGTMKRVLQPTPEVGLDSTTTT